MDKEKRTNMKSIEIYNEIALFLAEEHMIALDEKIRFLALVREDAELCRQR